MGSTAEQAVKGGSFLVEEIRPDQIFVPEEITEEQELMAKTAEEFINKDVLPHLEQLEKQDLELTKKLLRKAGDLGLLGADVPEPMAVSVLIKSPRR